MKKKGADRSRVMDVLEHHGGLQPGVAKQVQEETGIPEADVLKAATINGARAMRVDDRLGTIEKGKLADLVVVDGNPLADITHARDPVYVIRDGEVHSPADLLKQVENKIGPEGPEDHENWKLVVSPLRD